MRFLEIKLINYIGIYDGMGLDEIHIDFTKCIHKTIVIKGKNGAGKSTLKNALSFFPDPLSKLRPGLQGEKWISAQDGNTIYKAKIISPIKENGDRATTKAYITKTDIDTKQTIDLNINGNISSYKDIIFSELKLDPSFMSLSQLGSEDKGLASKTPGERKRFVASIIDQVEVYNNINKTLTKRNSVFKSMINNLVGKISSIGEESSVKTTLKSIENRLNNMMNTKDNYIEELATHKSKIKLIDPDGSIQQTYNSIYNSLIDINKSLSENTVKKESILIKLNVNKDIKYEDILQNRLKLKDRKNDLNNKVNSLETITESLLSNREEDAKSIQIKSSKLDSLQSTRNYKDLKKELKISKDKLSSYQEILSQIGLQDISNISKEEFIIGLNAVKDIKDIIDSFKANIEHGLLESSIEWVKKGLYPNIDNLDEIIANLNSHINSDNSKLEKYITLKSISDKLQLRPGKCNIDNCGFIKDAIEAFNQNPDNKINELQKELITYNNELNSKEELKIEYTKTIECINQLKVLLRNIERNALTLNKFPMINNIFTNRDVLFDKILNGYDFKELDILYQYLQYANIIDEYKTEKKIYDELMNDYNIYLSKEDILNELMNDIDELNNKLNSITSEIDKNNQTIFNYKKEITTIESTLLDYDLLCTIFDNENALLSQKQDLIMRYNNIKNNIVIIKESMNNINTITNNINALNNEIKPLIEDRDKLNHGLLLLKDYKQELSLYQAKYNKIEVIKKHSSINGIQSLFMELYMNTTLELANELMALLFDGEYALGQFIINEKEFKIPCMGDRMMHDDISDMSCGQVSLISMIISFVLLQQSSSKFNIPELDELDAGLDAENRRLFLNVLDRLEEMMQVEQCFLISHNGELDLSNCDIIQLKMPNGENIQEGNIIWKYNFN